ELPPISLQQISHFFEHYKDLEPNKWVKIDGWYGIEDAREEIMLGVKNFAETPDKPQF
ncbi:MAG: inorganic diphosphatase, partial [Gallionellaceae bacterium]